MLNESIIFANKITIKDGIFSGPVALFGFNFLIILLICSAVAKGILYLFSDLSTLLFMLMILLWYSDFLIIDLTVDISRVLLFGFPSISGALPVLSQCLHNENWMCYCLFISKAFLCNFLKIRFFIVLIKLLQRFFKTLHSQEVFSWWPFKIPISCFWFTHYCLAKIISHKDHAEIFI